MHCMDIPRDTPERQSSFDWQSTQIYPLLHNNNSNNNNTNLIVWDKILTTTRQKWMNLNNLPAKCKQ